MRVWSFRVIYANPSTRLVIIRCRHGPHNFLASALPFVTKVGLRLGGGDL